MAATRNNRTYLLIDAAPGMEATVFESLGTLPQVMGKKLLHHGNVDMVAILETRDHDRAEAMIGNQIRFLSGVRNVTELRDHDLDDLPYPVREALVQVREGIERK